MARRIGLWALIGFAVAFFWFVYFTWLNWGAYHGGPAFTFSQTTETLVNITAPIRPLFGHHAIKWYWSLFLNASLYACAGMTVEIGRQLWRLNQIRLRH